MRCTSLTNCDIKYTQTAVLKHEWPRKPQTNSVQTCNYATSFQKCGSQPITNQTIQKAYLACCVCVSEVTRRKCLYQLVREFHITLKGVVCTSPPLISMHTCTHARTHARTHAHCAAGRTTRAACAWHLSSPQPQHKYHMKTGSSPRAFPFSPSIFFHSHNGDRRCLQGLQPCQHVF